MLPNIFIQKLPRFWVTDFTNVYVFKVNLEKICVSIENSIYFGGVG